MVVIVNALRTPIGKYGGSLSNLDPEEMLSILMNNNLSHAGIDSSQIDGIVIGQTDQKHNSPDLARLSSRQAGFPGEIIAYTVNSQNEPSIQSINIAYMSIITGQSKAMIAGGVGKVSQTIDIQEYITTYHLNAEMIARQYGITREKLDEYALSSYIKSRKAIKEEKFVEEIVPIEVKEDNYNNTLFAIDENPYNIDLNSFLDLATVYPNGTVTEGNVSGIHDGASTLLLMEEKKAESLGLIPIAQVCTIRSFGITYKSGKIGNNAITTVIKETLQLIGLDLRDIDLIGLNDSSVAENIVILSELKKNFNSSEVNVNGGSISLGNPVGCTGTCILTSLVHEMKKRNVLYGLALSIAEGQEFIVVLKN
ncbi:acetyl-CoA C-acyltransferase [Virgibacillus dakarensis]|nr:acetyl-CoA C-acyltransferase [Virgibacillus dakarensis]